MIMGLNRTYHASRFIVVHCCVCPAVRLHASFYCTLKVHVQNCILYFSFVLCSVGNNAATAYRSRLAATANDGLIVSKVFCRIKTSAHKSTIYTIYFSTARRHLMRLYTHMLYKRLNFRQYHENRHS